MALSILVYMGACLEVICACLAFKDKGRLGRILSTARAGWRLLLRPGRADDRRSKVLLAGWLASTAAILLPGVGGGFFPGLPVGHRINLPSGVAWGPSKVSAVPQRWGSGVSIGKTFPGFFVISVCSQGLSSVAYKSVLLWRASRVNFSLPYCLAMPNQPANTVLSGRRSSKYFIADGDVIFKVRNYAFIPLSSTS